MDNQTRDCSSVVTEVWDKVMFLHLSVIVFTRGGGWFPNMHHRSHDQGGFDGPPPQHYGIRSTSGWYAPYWNAFLFMEYVILSQGFR